MNPARRSDDGNVDQGNVAGTPWMGRAQDGSVWKPLAKPMSTNRRLSVDMNVFIHPS